MDKQVLFSSMFYFRKIRGKYIMVVAARRSINVVPASLARIHCYVTSERFKIVHIFNESEYYYCKN